MPAVQSTYLQNIPVGKAGFVPDMTQADLISRTVETVTGIPFGSAVAQGAADKGGILYAGTGFLGVAVRERSVLIGEQFSLYESARVLKKGPIWVAVAVAVSAGQPVYLTPAGAFTNVVGSNFPVPNARFDTSTTGAGLAVIFIK
ncbi:MAG: structural cement protein Gp24 [Janthinobacterium lividum]